MQTADSPSGDPTTLEVNITYSTPLTGRTTTSLILSDSEPVMDESNFF
jgi:hypothetical protein